MEYNAFIGLDVHRDTIAVAIADAGRDGEVRLWGTIPNTSQSLAKVLKKLIQRHKNIEVVYEAGPCGYGIYRQLNKAGIACRVIAPSRMPRVAGERVKNDTRDAITLARLLRAGELTFIWVPDEVHEAVRDLVRARHGASNDLRRSRQRILSFLLKYGRKYDSPTWRYKHRMWLANQSFEHPAQQITFQSYLNAEEQAEARRDQIDAELKGLLPHWSLIPAVEALQALRGIGPVIATSIVAEICDFQRFSNPRQLMAFLGLIPGEHSSGKRKSPRAITKTGNSPVRALLFEASWHYARTPKVGEFKLRRRPDVAQEFKDIAWKAQLRLNKRFRYLVAKGKKSQVAVTAVARELVGFIWAIGCAAEQLPCRQTP